MANAPPIVITALVNLPEGFHSDEGAFSRLTNEEVYNILQEFASVEGGYLPLPRSAHVSAATDTRPQGHVGPGTASIAGQAGRVREDQSWRTAKSATSSRGPAASVSVSASDDGKEFTKGYLWCGVFPGEQDRNAGRETSCRNHQVVLRGSLHARSFRSKNCRIVR